MPGLNILSLIIYITCVSLCIISTTPGKSVLASYLVFVCDLVTVVVFVAIAPIGWCISVSIRADPCEDIVDKVS